MRSKLKLIWAYICYTWSWCFCVTSRQVGRPVAVVIPTDGEWGVCVQYRAWKLLWASLSELNIIQIWSLGATTSSCKPFFRKLRSLHTWLCQFFLLQKKWAITQQTTTYKWWWYIRLGTEYTVKPCLNLERETVCVCRKQNAQSRHPKEQNLDTPLTRRDWGETSKVVAKESVL